MSDEKYYDLMQELVNKESEISLLKSNNERLMEKCNRLIMMCRHLDPERFPGTYFIHMHTGDKDVNGMPKYLHVVPAYGVDFNYIYERTEKTWGPEW